MLLLDNVIWDKKLSSVAMISILNHNDTSYTYTLWALEKNKLYLFDEEYRLGHILFLNWTVEEIEPNSYYLTTNQNHKLKIDLYFGGSL